MMRVDISTWTAVTQFQVKATRILKELVRYDASAWCVHGSRDLQTAAEKGAQGDIAEFMHRLILQLGVEARFAGTQQSGTLPTASEFGWIAEKRSDTAYVRLPISIDSWNEQKLNATITAVDGDNYRIDIPTKQCGPFLLYITLQRFDNDLNKIRMQSVTPNEVTHRR